MQKMFIDFVDESVRNRLVKAVEIARKHKTMHLFTHYDADGMASVSIIRTALQRAGIECTYQAFTTLGHREMESVRNVPAVCFIMTDMGTSFLPEMADYQCDCVVLDHHQIPDSFDLDQEGKVFVSCWLAGVSGAHDACASTMAFLFAMAMDESNFDLATVAIAGMMGDNQHRPAFSGYNKVIVDEAVSRGLIKTMDSIVPLGNVYESVMFTIDPYLDGISGVPDSVRDFLFGLGFNTTSSLKFGDSESAARLDEAIIAKLREKSVEEDVISRLVRKRYYLTDFECDAQLLSDTIDACGRTDAAATAMKVIDSHDLMAGRGAYIEFRRQLLAILFDAIEHMTPLENIRYFMYSSRGYGGLVSATLIKYWEKSDLPIIALLDAGDVYDISSRCSAEMEKRGINMGDAMKATAIANSGEGGGHSNAAGGRIPKDSLAKFLKDIDWTIGMQKQ